VNGPKPSQFNPFPYVEQWLKDGHHAASDAPSSSTGKQRKPEPSESSIATIFL